MLLSVPATTVVRHPAGDPATAGSSSGRSRPRYDPYRGTLRVVAAATTPTVSVVNDLALEHYLRGVVPVEMPSTWPAAALQAQAIAARSYAARRLRPGVSYFDVADDTRSQVYRGVAGEQAATNAAIAATAGLVLRSGSSIANALFHSTGGGATENNENVYTSADRRAGRRPGQLPARLERPARRRAAYDDAAPYATWTSGRYTRTQLSAWFAADPRTNVGDLTRSTCATAASRAGWSA